MPSPCRRPSLSIDPTLTKDIHGYGGRRLPTPNLQTPNSTLSTYETVKLGELATRKAGFSQNSFRLSEKAKAVQDEMDIQSDNSDGTDNLEGIAPTTPMQTEFPTRHAVPGSPKSLPANALPTERPKQRRRRTKLHEYMVLEAAFCKDPLPDAPTREWLARELIMSPRAVQVWFQNRRQALKRKNEIEMFHADMSMNARYGTMHQGNAHFMSWNGDAPQRNENQARWSRNEFDSAALISNKNPGCSCKEKRSANGVQQCLTCLNLVNAFNNAFECQAKLNLSRRETKRLDSDPERRGLRGLVAIAPKGQSIGERRASRLGMRSQDLLASLTLASVAAQPRYPASASIAASILSPIHTHGIYNSPSSPRMPSLPLSPFGMTQFHPPAPCCSPDMAMFPASSRRDDYAQNSANGIVPLTPGLSSAFGATHIGDHLDSEAKYLDSAALPTPNLTPAASPPKSDITSYYPGNCSHSHRRPFHKLPVRIDASHNGFSPSICSPLTMGLNGSPSADAAVKESREEVLEANVKNSALNALCETAAKQEHLSVPLTALQCSPEITCLPSNDMEFEAKSLPTTAGSAVEMQELNGAVGQLWRPWD